MSANVNPGEVEQLIPLQSVHATVQSNPCFRHVHWVHTFSAILQGQLEVSILEARVYCPMYTIPSRLGSIRHQLQSSTGTVEKLAYCESLQQQMLVAKCAHEHKRFLLQPSMQICNIVVYLNFHLRSHHTK